uniref:Uncharacterized protein n=1 Tax=Populus trichocarpa TaxID=3694 RepID=A9PEE6_POPTR|nr:unknown [Populus trichocarpa]
MHQHHWSSTASSLGVKISQPPPRLFHTHVYCSHAPPKCPLLQSQSQIPKPNPQ